MVTHCDLTRIVAQASFLYERLDNRLFNDNTMPDEQQVIDDRLKHWCKVVAQDNWEVFHKRLLWDGWVIAQVSLCLGTLPLVDSRDLPRWAETLREIMQATSEFARQDKFPLPIDPEEPLPFEDLWLPAIVVARQKLLTRLGSESLLTDNFPLKLLSESAYLSLERSLLEKLVNLSVKSLAHEFSHSRPLGHSLLNLVIGETKARNSKVHYSGFVQKVLQDRLLAFFQKYPVLGRLIATAIDFWVDTTEEFVQRLKADISKLESMKWGMENGKGSVDNELLITNKIKEIKTSLSDPHNQGRSVIALTFDSGLKLIYKPKNFGLEVAYNEFLDWCNQQGVSLPFKVLKVLDCGTYGWMEYVEHLPIEDEAQAKRFYQRAGMLLCLLYVLRGTDCHYENLIASGEHLVLIDLETLIHHEASLIKDPPEAIEAEMSTLNQNLWDSVLRTGLLPHWGFHKDNSIAYDISGLGSGDPQTATMWKKQWKSVNTDDMHHGYEEVTMPVQANVPILHGVALSPNDYLEEFVTGFEQMYHFLMERQEVLLADNSPLLALQGQPVRFIFRATRVYFSILQKIQSPEFLRDGVEWSIELDILSRAFLHTYEKPKCWQILQAELRAMEQLDIPYFGAKSDSDALTAGLATPIKQYFTETSYNQVLTKLQKLSQADLAQQVEIIQGAFYARVARKPIVEQALETSGTIQQTADFSQINPLTSEQLLEQAIWIAQEIQKRGLKSADGNLNWISLNYVSNAERFQLMPLGNSLYDGKCGIALFLAALANVTGSTQFRETALGALQSVRKFLHTYNAQSAHKSAKYFQIGGATGLGSIIYSLVKISQFLGEADLLEDAKQFAKLITPEVIAADRVFDVIGGSAGTILGLLALYSKTGEPMVLEKAVGCGQHLLWARVKVDDSPTTFKAFKNLKPLTGFSHGAAGIAYALLLLYAVTQDASYLDKAREEIAYERSVFSEAAGNWPDFRNLSKPKTSSGFMVSWCHGAPGIGLGRLGGLSILDTEQIRQDIEVALQTTQKYGLQGIDSLCCGTLGRSEVLLVAAHKLSNPQLREIAQKQAAWVVAKADQIGGYQLIVDLPSSAFIPGFFLGMAGVGYEFLRLAYPDLLPSVLLWE